MNPFNSAADLSAWNVRLDAIVPLASPLSVLLSLAVLLVLTFTAYQWALPKPLPGVPYNKAAAKSILGDLPELARQFGNGDAQSWIGGLAARFNSPIVQIFTGGLPTLVISDFRTTQDILHRRTREFERPSSQLESFKAMVPHHHITMLTADPQFRKNRELVKDLMASPFLHTVNAPQIWENTLQFIELWRWKAEMAGGRPFDAAEDVAHMTFDIIKNAALGKDDTTLIGLYLDQLRAGAGEHSTTARGENVPFPFPAPPQDDVLEAQNRMNEAITGKGIWPAKLFHIVNGLRPHMREAFGWKHKMLKRQVTLAVERMEAGEPLQSAVDFMIQREIAAAKKEERDPVFDSLIMYDELYGYIGAGHDTTAATFTWGLKLLTREPEAQRKARQNLHEVYTDAHAQGRQPTVEEIINTHAPYLDALIEEIIRVSGPVGAIVRTATVDTVLMGRPIPKGTNLFLAFWGAGFTSPSIQDSLPGVDAAEGKAPSYTKRDNWDGMEPEKFVPERWLAQDAEGHMVYDAQAGPMLGFSLGLRGCFGKRLAYLTLRTLFTLLLWNFELQPVPAELDSWKANVKLTRKPVQCYVRLAEVR